MIKTAKPFIKWVGGKSQLITQLEALLPADFDSKDDVTYIEPFVGGGAMLFYMLQTHQNITRAVINDINPDLTTCYQVVRDQPNELILSLAAIQEEFYAIYDEEAQKEYFLRMRDRFNAKSEDPIENTTLFFFLNRTCFNGLYRVNKSGKFNVPFGSFKRPLICDPYTILADSMLLQRVTILTGDFEQTFDYIRGNTFFYFDPPYRPLSDTSSFIDYSKESFNDNAQIRLKRFCDRLQGMKVQFMLSNSDCSGENGEDRFFDNLYKDYDINRVKAARNINSNGAKRGKLTEILVRNYTAQSESINMVEPLLTKGGESFMDYDSISDLGKIDNNVYADKDGLIKRNCLLGKVSPYYKSLNGDFTLLAGDCTRLLPLIDFKFDMIFADPPYFLSNGGISVQSGKIVSVNKGEWDEGGTFDSVNEFNLQWIEQCRDKLKDNGSIWVSGTYHNIFSVANALQQLGFKILNVITWAKTNPPPNISCRFFTHSTEFVIWARKSKTEPHYYNYELMKRINGGKQMTDVWHLPAIARWEKSCGKHPTQKPLSLLVRIILASTAANSWILDPFAGSSTTGIAASLIGRRFLGIERDRDFLALSRARREEIDDSDVRKSYCSKIKDLAYLSSRQDASVIRDRVYR